METEDYANNGVQINNAPDEQRSSKVVRCDSAYVSIENCVELILNQLESVVNQVEGVTMEQALD